VWRLVREQGGVVSRRQLRELDYSEKAIEHRRASGRLHPTPWRGVYSVGRPELTRRGLFVAAVLACGKDAVLIDASAADLWHVRAQRGGPIEVSARTAHDLPGIRTRRRHLRAADITTHQGVRVTTPVRTLVDLAACLTPLQIERCVNEADKLELIDPESLREQLDDYPGIAGVGRLRRILDIRTFTLTDSENEQRFLPIARKAGLPRPLTREWVNGFRVDFYWPELKLIVETDGLRYHRTPAEQALDRLRDQAHTAAGFTCLRFTRAQIRYDAGHVHKTLAQVAARLQRP
jgi:very-short-patch-repair endonuclease